MTEAESRAFGRTLAYHHDMLVSNWKTHGPDAVYEYISDFDAETLKALVMMSIGSRAHA